ncbi:hypothetical protein MMIC_P1726 [Mariprofundus micogutta]|uniref:Uncharacterized protein n=1 Tax=Mariprofundus micogutta TaxID=1921010 RepID=A0A1L8CPE7_9PROT|nr:hypothetical protein MMIC_P1726 [Mariprofundus micogutta]
MPDLFSFSLEVILLTAEFPLLSKLVLVRGKNAKGGSYVCYIS